MDSLRFVEIMKNTDKFVKGDILQVACITDKEVDVVHHMAITTIPKSCCILTTKSLPESECVSFSTIRELMKDGPVLDVKTADVISLSLSQDNSKGYHMCVGFDEEVSSDPRDSQKSSLSQDNGYVPSQYPLQHW